MCLCSNNDNIDFCYICFREFDYYKLLMCEKCLRTFHYKCAYNYCKYLDTCPYCGNAKLLFMVKKNKYL